MSQTGSDLLQSVLALPESERAEIAEAIFCSLDETEEQESDEAELLQELHRRAEEMKNDPSSRVPWSELKNQL